MDASKTRALLKHTLHTDVQFVHSMRAYLKKTQGLCTFYENRLHFDANSAMWTFVDNTRQCRCCGLVLGSMHAKVKLMSCAACKITHYCNRACQKMDWKSAHKQMCPSTERDKTIHAVAIACVRILTLMCISPKFDLTGTDFTVENPSVLKSHFSFEAHDDTVLDDDAFALQMHINDNDNRVCNHFRARREPNRILYPVWETATDNLAFIPVSLDFVYFELGAPVGSAAPAASLTEDSARIRYPVFVKGVADGKCTAATTHSFVVVGAAAVPPAASL